MAKAGCTLRPSAPTGTSDSNICDLMICTLPYRSRRLADSQNCSHCSSASSAFWLLPVDEGKGEDEHPIFLGEGKGRRETGRKQQYLSRGRSSASTAASWPGSAGRCGAEQSPWPPPESVHGSRNRVSRGRGDSRDERERERKGGKEGRREGRRDGGRQTRGEWSWG